MKLSQVFIFKIIVFSSDEHLFKLVFARQIDLILFGSTVEHFIGKIVTGGIIFFWKRFHLDVSLAHF